MLLPKLTHTCHDRATIWHDPGTVPPVLSQIPPRAGGDLGFFGQAGAQFGWLAYAQEDRASGAEQDPALS